MAIAPVTAHPDYIPPEIEKTYSYDELADTAPVISRAVMTQCFQHARLHGKDPNAFPLLDTQIISVLPKLYVATAGCDPLRDDGRVFAAALEGKGVDVRRRKYGGLPHGLWFFNTLPEWNWFVLDTVDAIRWVVG